MSTSGPEFKPGDVNLLGSFPPLCATMGKTEVEVAAAYLCRALSVKGNEWRPIKWAEISEVVKADIKTATGDKSQVLPKLFADLARNPFAVPDFHTMVAKGFARWLGEPGKSELEMTDAGRERLRKWVNA